MRRTALRDLRRANPGCHCPSFVSSSVSLSACVLGVGISLYLPVMHSITDIVRLAVLAVAFLPELPTWLAVRDRHIQARSSLDSLRRGWTEADVELEYASLIAEVENDQCRTFRSSLRGANLVSLIIFRPMSERLTFSDGFSHRRCQWYGNTGWVFPSSCGTSPTFSS